ncbi:MAG: tetraacyldisaccharide 4'-kinase [Fibrobacter sp.]|nr:tetraacyldisaccharide 4'-kinase [Fibrobacter sp.]
MKYEVREEARRPCRDYRHSSSFTFHFSFRKIVAAYYWAAYSLHHALCLRPGEPLKNSKLVVIGSYRTGGAGKTPFSLWLAKNLLAHGKTVAVLCHEYAYDEIAFLKSELKNFKYASVIGTRNRYATAHHLDKAEAAEFKGAPDYIICDDGFEDSRLRPFKIFRLDWEKEPTDINELVPAGKFRSLKQDHRRDEAITTAVRCYGTSPDVIFQIDSIKNSAGEFPKYRQSIAVCGLGDPGRFIRDLERSEYPIQETVICPDHDRNFSRKLLKVIQKNLQKNIFISEKDSYRLPAELLSNPQLFVAKQKISVLKDTYLRALL